jgi:exopolyphosphatase / guanosine-5'-triphosphate,3'-diphosphate pyrophosphatase
VTTETIVPRWEWRTFGEHFGEADTRFAALSPERIQESDEVYLLSEPGGDTVKVRDSLMDIKHLEHVNEDGLEQWLPVTKAAFPLTRAGVESVLAALHVEPAQPLVREAYTLDQLLDEVVRTNNDLLAVEVHKLRRRYTIAGCMAELTDVRTAHGSTRTIAIESEDAAGVVRAVGELDLASRPNESFPHGLKELVLFGGIRYAVIDVGTNSVKFHVGERSTDGSWATIVDRAEVTRLGEGLRESGRLQPEPIERTIEAIAGMADQARSEQAVAIAAVGTAGLRIASNSDEFVAAVFARCGVEVDVISGEEEGRLAYLAVKTGIGLAEGALVVFDTGGGSSQFTFGDGERVDDQFSLNVGAARFTEQFRLDEAVSEQELAAALDAIAADLAPLDGRTTPDALVGMGGAITNLTAVKHELATYDPDIVQGTVLDRAEIDRQIELYRTRSADERRQIVGLQPKRAEVILAGACIVRTVMTKLGRESLTVSDRGLRHGLLVERFGDSGP